MKKLIIAIMCVGVLFTSCDMIVDVANEVEDSYLENNFKGHVLYFSDSYVSCNKKDTFTLLKTIAYSFEAKFQDPEITATTLTGDCNSRAILFLNVWYFSTGEEGKIAVVKIKDREIVNGGLDLDHTIVYAAGKYFDPYSGRVYLKSDIMYEYSFRTVFSNSF